MKKISLLIMLVLFVSFALFSQIEEIKIGKVYFPKAFVHASKDYNKGVYRIILTVKDGIPYFKVLNKKNELLFEEMAVLKPNEGKFKKFKYRIKKELLKGYEYFRIKVTKPDNLVMAYFLVKK